MSLLEAFYGRRLRLYGGVLAATSVAAGLAVADLALGNANYSPGYLVPLIAVAPFRRPAALFTCAAVLVAVTFAGYLFSPTSPIAHPVPLHTDYRLYNRSFIAAALVGSAFVLTLLHRRTRTRELGESGGEVAARRARLWAAGGRVRRVAGACAAGVFVMVLVADTLAPARLNLAMLHLLVVVLASLTGNRTALWTAAAAAVVATRVGYDLGPVPPPAELVPTLLTNRLLVRLAVVGVALLLDPWVAESEAAADLDAPQESGDVEAAAPPASASLDGNGHGDVRLPPHPGPKRVLFFDHASRMGGGEIALLGLVAHLDRSRYLPVVLLAEDGPLADRLRDIGVDTHVLPLAREVLDTRKDTLDGRALFRVRHIRTIVRYVAGLAQFMRLGRFDLVHTNSLKSDILGGIAGRLAGRTVLWHVRDRIDPDYIPRIAVHAFRTACCAFADYVVTNSHATMALLRPTFGDTFGERAARERMRVVHDGVNRSAFVRGRPPVDGARAPAIGLVGRISPFKGQDVFVRAAAEVHRHFPTARFRIIGSALFGEQAYEQEVRDLVDDLGLQRAVEFTGFRTDVANEIAALDVLVHASVTGEPFGQVIVEGMAAGRPVVATNGGGVPEIVQDGVSGLLVPMRDPGAIADAVCGLLADPSKAIRIAAAGRERVEESFTIELTARRVQQFYDDMFRPPQASGGHGPRLWRGLSVAVQWAVWAAVFLELGLAIAGVAQARLAR